MRSCEWCGANIMRKNAQARYCSTRCRVAAHRSTYPAEMTSRHTWVRAIGKRPIQPSGAPASSTDPTTWSSYADVKPSRTIQAGDGYGIMLGNGIGCYDLDHVTDDQARELIKLIPEPIIYTERSMSGNGIHVFVSADETAGTKNWHGHERYTRQRFIRLTGHRITL